MKTNSTRIDRFISRRFSHISQKDVRLLLAQKRVSVDGVVITDANQIINRFSYVTLDGEVLQNNTPAYIMLNKPRGVVSATKDNRHKTVVDLLKSPEITGLHIVGRLDFNSTGLLLLTNDSRWSRKIMSPVNKVTKEYMVRVEKPLTEEYIKAFDNGMYFEYEDITTLPAKLDIITKFEARVTLMEGRYHQIKRMFGRFNNKVMELHRVSIGGIALDSGLKPGQHRELLADEIKAA